MLELEGRRSLRVGETDGECVVDAEGTGVVTTCPDCGPGKGRLYGHGSQMQSFRDTPMHGMPVRLSIRRRRFQCQACHKTLFEPLAAMDDTRRLLGYVHRQVFSETFASLARQVGLGEKTIRNVCEDYVAEWKATIRFRTRGRWASTS